MPSYRHARNHRHASQLRTTTAISTAFAHTVDDVLLRIVGHMMRKKGADLPDKDVVHDIRKTAAHRWEHHYDVAAGVDKPAAPPQSWTADIMFAVTKIEESKEGAVTPTTQPEEEDTP